MNELCVSSGDNFVRDSGNGWWSVERKQSSVQDEEDEPFADFDVLRNPTFLILCLLLVVAQVLAVLVVMYMSKKTKKNLIAETGREKPNNTSKNKQKHQ